MTTWGIFLWNEVRDPPKYDQKTFVWGDQKMDMAKKWINLLLTWMWRRGVVNTPLLLETVLMERFILFQPLYNILQFFSVLSGRKFRISQCTKYNCTTIMLWICSKTMPPSPPPALLWDKQLEKDYFFACLNFWKLAPSTFRSTSN